MTSSAGQRPTQVGVLAAKIRAPLAQGLARPRLDQRLDEIWGRRVALVVAPAGSGKTTLLARFATGCGVPFGWYRAESWDVGEERLLRHLRAALEPLLGEQPVWDSVEVAVAALESWPGERLLLVVDDLHAISGTASERSLERLLDYAPPSFALAAASRTAPGWSLSRRRVSGTILEVAGDDLRFRSWEVERLFSDFYGEPLPPVEQAELARRTEGWAAGLQLFHLATSGKPADERRRVLSSLGPRSSLAREYLAENVLEGLPAELREFLLSTCVLGRLSGPICDSLRGSTDSEILLQELERRQLFTQRIDDQGSYRYHEVLRSHLEGLLIHQLDAEAARSAFRHAGEVLAEAGAPLEALHAFCRAEDWAAVDILLGVDGDRLSRQPGHWIDALPPAVVDQDPWLLLTRARAQRAAGSLGEALRSYQQAEVAFGAAERGRTCHDERQALSSWLQPTPRPARDLLSLVRVLLARNPLDGPRTLPGLDPASDELAGGLAALLAGDLPKARRQLEHCSNRPDAGPLLTAAACLAGCACMLLGGDLLVAEQLDRVVDRLDEMGQPMLSRLGRAAATLTGRPETAKAAVAALIACEEAGDEWGAALARVLGGWAGINAGGAPVDLLEHATASLRRLGAATLEAWAQGLLALAMARQGAPEAREVALQAEAFARSSGVPNAQLYPYLALALLDSDRASDFVALAENIRRETAISTPSPPEQDAVEASAGVQVRCFGGFSIQVAGKEADLGMLKPKARSLLRLLAINGGNPVHREAIQEALWPEADAESAVRGLHVAISAARRLLEPDVPRGGASLLRREGEAYRLALGSDAVADVVEYDLAAAAARTARQRSDLPGLADAFEKLCALHAGDLLPEDGSAEWVLGPRERCRAALVESSQALAAMLAAAGRPADAAEVCAAGLRVERYQDALWQMLIAAREQTGEVGAANRARSEYEHVLAELGVTPAPTHR